MISSLKRNREGLVSLVVLLVVVLAALISLATPLLYHADRYRSELRRDMRVLQELRSIDSAQEDIRKALDSYQERNLHSWIYVGDNTDQISLDVQRKVSAWLDQVQTQRVTPVAKPNANETYTAVGVQVQFTASMKELFEIINQIGHSKPLLVIDRMQVTPVPQRRTSNQPEPPQRVRVQMTVQTYVASGGSQ